MQKVPQSHSKIFKSFSIGGKNYPLRRGMVADSVEIVKGKAIFSKDGKVTQVDIESGKVDNFIDRIKSDFGEYWENSLTYVKAVRVAIAIPAIMILAIKEVLGWIVGLLDELLRILANISTGGRA